MPQNGCIPNEVRGGGCYWGPDVTEKVLGTHDLQLLVRSHECKQEGYEFCHDRRVSTETHASVFTYLLDGRRHLRPTPPPRPDLRLPAGTDYIFSIQLLRGGQQQGRLHKNGTRSGPPLCSISGQQDVQGAHAEAKVGPASFKTQRSAQFPF